MLLYGKSWFLIVLLLHPISFDMEQVETVPSPLPEETVWKST
jgi:hypothetical protein